MSYRLPLPILFIVLTLSALAQEKYEVKRSDFNFVEIVFSATDNLNVENVLLKGRDFTSVSMNGFGHLSEIGRPSLPVLREMIEIPLCDGVSIEVKNESHIMVNGAMLGITRLVAPVQPSLCKTASRNTALLSFDDNVYCTDAFYGPDVVTVNKIGVARDRCLAEVVFSPVAYNPVTNQFLIYTEVDAVVTFKSPDIEATTAMKQLHRSPAFGQAVNTINRIDAGSDVTKASASSPMRYLIVANAMFRGRLDDFVSWKKRTGFIVDVAYTDESAVGSTQASIKSYIKSQYTGATASNPAPTFLLLVGDVEQLPAKTYTHDEDEHVSDLDYACWTDDDEIPDCYYGRFSAQNASQLAPQIQKTLMYERYEFPSDEFLGRALLVAGVDGGNEGDLGFENADPAMDYLAKLYVNGDNKPVMGDTSFYAYPSVTEYKNNPSANPYSTNVAVVSNSMGDQFREKCSEGAGFINYTAHGYDEGWGEPSLSNYDVTTMSNVKRCGLMIGNCCLSGKFDVPTCFGEALLRKNNYSGAVGYIGGSNYTYWGEDFYWAVGQRNAISANMNLYYMAHKRGAYDRMFHTHGENFDLWATTLGSILMSGNMAVQNSDSGLKDYYWQIYHVFGDPSLMPWLSKAKQMQLTYRGATIGATHITVNCVPYAYVAITTADNTLVGAAFAGSDGIADISCDQPLERGNYILASTAQNYKPLLLDVTVSGSAICDDREELTGAMRIYPNPTADRFFVDAVELQKIEIIDAVGRILSSQSGNVVDLSLFPSGLYSVRVTANGAVAVRKIMKQ